MFVLIKSRCETPFFNFPNHFASKVKKSSFKLNTDLNLYL